MAVTVLEGLDEVRAASGCHLGYSDWMPVGPALLDLFAAATGAHGETGYFLLALSNRLLPQIVEVVGVRLGLNYGTGRVRFPAPLPAHCPRVRAGVALASVDDVPGGVQTTMLITLEAAGGDQPVCTIEALSRYLS